MAIKHSFVSQIPDSGESGKVAPSNWNANHVVDDNTLAVSKLTTTAQQFLVPSGGIIMWSGTIASIPAGWYLCDGNNGTPDLRDKFVVGARQDASSIAKTLLEGSLTQSGGDISHTHAEHAAHSHSSGTLSTESDGDHTHDISGSTGEADTSTGALQDGGNIARPPQAHVHDAGTLATATDGAHTHTVDGGTADNPTGTTGTQHTSTDAPQPYFALAYIMKG